VLVDRDSGQIVLDLTAAYDRIKAPLDQIAPKLAQELPSRDELRVVLLERTQLTTAWDLVDRVKGVITIATVVAVALLAAGIALSVERWRALARAGWIAVGGLAVLLLSLVVTRSYIADRISDAVYARAAKSGFGIVTHGLVVQSIVVAVIAGVVALAAGWTDRHGLVAWPEAARRGWRRVEVMVPGPGEAPAGAVTAGAAAGAAGVARAAGAVKAEVAGALDRVVARGGARARHGWRAAALLGVGLFAVLDPGGLTTVVVVLLGAGALYLALIEGLAVWRSPKQVVAPPPA
jgi:hypothetical protein